MSRFLQDLESPSGFNPRALTRIVSVPADAMSSPHDHLCTVETGLTHFSGGWMVATPGSGRRANPLNREKDSSPYLPDVLVLCSQSLFRFADLGDDGLCRGGPDKGCGVIVSAIDVVVDRLD